MQLLYSSMRIWRRIVKWWYFRTCITEFCYFIRHRIGWSFFLLASFRFLLAIFFVPFIIFEKSFPNKLLFINITVFIKNIYMVGWACSMAMNSECFIAIAVVRGIKENVFWSNVWCWKKLRRFLFVYYVKHITSAVLQLALPHILQSSLRL